MEFKIYKIANGLYKLLRTVKPYFGKSKMQSMFSISYYNLNNVFSTMHFHKKGIVCSGQMIFM